MPVYDRRRDGFRVDRVSLTGGMGAMMAIAGLLTLLELEAVRWFSIAVIGGVLFGLALAWVRRR